MIDSVWLKDELNNLRLEGISRQGFSDARTYAQTRKHVSMLTVSESVRMIFVTLYSPNKQPLIKKLIKGPTLSKIPTLDFNAYVNKWIQLDYPYGKDLILKLMIKSPAGNVGELVDIAKKYQITIDLMKLRRTLGMKRVRRSDKISQRQFLRFMRTLPSLSI